MIPEDFPYTVRLVSQVLESNGSSWLPYLVQFCLMDAVFLSKNLFQELQWASNKNPAKRNMPMKIFLAMKTT